MKVEEIREPAPVREKAPVPESVPDETPKEAGEEIVANG